MGSLGHWERNFTGVGWFIPPYMQMGIIGQIAGEIEAARGQFTQTDLEAALARLYEPEGLAAMVLSRYPVTPIIRDYQATIGEAVEAHFLGLDHVAAGGLIPVIEGAGRRLASERGLSPKSVTDVFVELSADCKTEAVTRQIGATGEIASMLDAFASFARTSLFVNSIHYPFDDGTNRHGIAHGAYSDADYGRPLNFYKTIAAIDILTWIAAFRANISWFAPSLTGESMRLAGYYRSLRAFAMARRPA
jgi:hypothetical protein